MSAVNAYCARLELPVPRVEEVATKQEVKLFHLMVVALLEQGAPMSLEAITERLNAAGITPATLGHITAQILAWIAASVSR